MKKYFAIIAVFFAIFAFMPANALADATATATTSSSATASGGHSSSGSSSSIGAISPTQTTTVGGQTTEVGGQTTEVGGQTTEVGGQSVTINNEATDLSKGRAFANPGGVQFGPTLNYFGQPLPSEGFQPIEQIIMYSCWYTEDALESMLKGVEKADAEFKVANENVTDAAPAPEDGETRWIKVVISLKKYEGDNVAFKGFVTARSENRKTTMVETMAKAALAAVKNGCNVIHFTAQGAVRDVESFGWGIGFNTTQAQIYSGNNSKSNVTSGGFGISKATAGTRDKPWLQGFGLVDYSLEYPALKVPAKETAEAETKTDESVKVAQIEKPEIWGTINGKPVNVIQ